MKILLLMNGKLVKRRNTQGMNLCEWALWKWISGLVEGDALLSVPRIGSDYTGSMSKKIFLNNEKNLKSICFFLMNWVTNWPIRVPSHSRSWFVTRKAWFIGWRLQQRAKWCQSVHFQNLSTRSTSVFSEEKQLVFLSWSNIAFILISPVVHMNDVSANMMVFLVSFKFPEHKIRQQDDADYGDEIIWLSRSYSHVR